MADATLVEPVEPAQLSSIQREELAAQEAVIARGRVREWWHPHETSE
jgi:hypothetical protein